MSQGGVTERVELFWQSWENAHKIHMHASFGILQNTDQQTDEGTVWTCQISNLRRTVLEGPRQELVSVPNS